mmetsp:Transcript_53714/g.130776  ORF Transcript_53714/g.130776 Transcript_53714/m.130776 type:complete len:235 (+) Transcript_53714:83-787(+)
MSSGNRDVGEEVPPQMEQEPKSKPPNEGVVQRKVNIRNNGDEDSSTSYGWHQKSKFWAWAFSVLFLATGPVLSLVAASYMIALSNKETISPKSQDDESADGEDDEESSSVSVLAQDKIQSWFMGWGITMLFFSIAQIALLLLAIWVAHISITILFFIFHLANIIFVLITFNYLCQNDWHLYIHDIDIRNLLFAAFVMYSLGTIPFLFVCFTHVTYDKQNKTRSFVFTYKRMNRT